MLSQRREEPSQLDAGTAAGSIGEGGAGVEIKSGSHALMMPQM